MGKTLEKHLQISPEPVADEKAVVKGDRWRFTILTSRLIRMEYDPDGRFEDRATQVVWDRRLPVPEFTVRENESQVEIETEHLHLIYRPGGNGFTRDSLRIKLKDSGNTWHYGDRDGDNLLGTARTLDGVDGATELESGLLSRAGWAVIDDSDSLVLTGLGWVEPRPPVEAGSAASRQDLYFFGYGHDYLQCLQDFCRISGRVPMPPRWILGNWWSRYWAYTQDELQALMEEFRSRGVPLSVCIIDMDWHVVDNPYTGGWTGYTWNRELFPEPYQFIKWLHENGLRTALNLHPADGVHPHEEQYEDMARSMGIDPDSKQPVEFDITDPDFIKAYFEILHHPMEEKGVDFWWLDWQQGTRSKMEGLDPLWALNHLHFLDSGRDKSKRPFIFSRWAGPGNQRYPIGFSGDTVVSWDSLDFQPYFTATASNVAYGWWSHDIGGHMFGQEDPELYARWVQWGVFSPILRLHSTKDPYLDRRPWGHGEDVFKVTKEALQLRHALIPYLYTMAWRDHKESISLINPMYYHSPEHEEAYCCPNQYYFGTELMVAPFTTPKDPETNLSRRVVWLPEGDWFDFWSGERYRGEGWQAFYGDLTDIPVLARAGAIVPLGPKVEWGGIDNPAELIVHVFPGASREFTLYEDDGQSQGYRHGQYALTRFWHKWNGDSWEFRIAPVDGDRTLVPESRGYQLRFRAIKQPDEVAVAVGGREVTCRSYCEGNSFVIELPGVKPDEEVVITLAARDDSLLSERDFTREKCQKMLRAFRMPTGPKGGIERAITEGALLDGLREHACVLSDAQMQALVETFAGVGVERIQPGGDKLVLWNNGEVPEVAWQFSAWYQWRKQADGGVIPRSRVIDLKSYQKWQWKLRADFFGLVQVVYQAD